MLPLLFSLPLSHRPTLPPHLQQTLRRWHHYLLLFATFLVQTDIARLVGAAFAGATVAGAHLEYWGGSTGQKNANALNEHAPI